MHIMHYAYNEFLNYVIKIRITKNIFKARDQILSLKIKINSF